MSVRPSVRMEQLGLHWTDFREILFEDFRNSVEKIQVLLKSDKNSGYFTWILIYHTCLSFFRMRNISDTVEEKIKKNIHFTSMIDKLLLCPECCMLSFG